jgi:hypothetical protein
MRKWLLRTGVSLYLLCAGAGIVYGVVTVLVWVANG